jgi:MFS family permease
MANASVQLAVDPALRGRVMGLYMLVFIGGTPIGAPIIGELTNHFAARVGMATCGAVPALAAAAVAVTAATAAARQKFTAPPWHHRAHRPRPSGAIEHLSGRIRASGSAGGLWCTQHTPRPLSTPVTLARLLRE